MRSARHDANRSDIWSGHIDRAEDHPINRPGRNPLSPYSLDLTGVAKSRREEPQLRVHPHRFFRHHLGLLAPGHLLTWKLWSARVTTSWFSTSCAFMRALRVAAINYVTHFLHIMFYAHESIDAYKRRIQGNYYIKKSLKSSISFWLIPARVLIFSI